MQQQVQTDFLDDVVTNNKRLQRAEQALVNDVIPIGGIIEWPLASNLLPANWLIANGQLVDRGTYQTLFSVISTTFGVGDGATTFQIPTYNAPAPLVWNAMSFAAGFSDYGAPFAPCGYAKDTEGIVHLRGVTKFTPTGSYPAGSMGVFLPAGYRPTYQTIFIVAANSTTNSMSRLDVLASTGEITRTVVTGNWDGVYMSYDGITFDSGSITAATAPPYMAIKAA